MKTVCGKTLWRTTFLSLKWNEWLLKRRRWRRWSVVFGTPRRSKKRVFSFWKAWTGSWLKLRGITAPYFSRGLLEHRSQKCRLKSFLWGRLLSSWNSRNRATLYIVILLVPDLLTTRVLQHTSVKVTWNTGIRNFLALQLRTRKCFQGFCHKTPRPSEKSCLRTLSTRLPQGWSRDIFSQWLLWLPHDEQPLCPQTGVLCPASLSHRRQTSTPCQGCLRPRWWWWRPRGQRQGAPEGAGHL